MVYRRVLFYWQFSSVVLLPGWVLVGQILWGSNLGWDLLLYIILAGLLSIALLVVFLLTRARKLVRDERALSWPDAAVLTIWHLAIITYGFVDSAPLAALIVAGAITAFWVAAWQLFAETRTRVKNAFALPDFPVDSRPVEAGHYDASVPVSEQIIIITPSSVDDEPGTRTTP